MNIYPAIDILGGKAVRLRQGRKEESTIYGDPVEMAVKWVAKGSAWLHVIDLDGAFEGTPRNLGILREMVKAVPQTKIQIGGGIRSMPVVETLLEAGILRVVLGTAAVQNPDFVRAALECQPDKVAVGIDARDGKAKVSGWTEDSRTTAIELASRLEDMGATLVVYTDIARDGVLTGPNIEATREMIERTRLTVIAAGGISSISDVRRLAELNLPRLDGVIIGKALYEGRIEIEEAMTHAR